MSQTPKKILSNRSFGLIFAVIFTLIALLPVLFSGAPRVWSLLLGFSFAAIALIYPAALSPLNRAWARFGQFMHKIMNPLLMGLVFFLTILPTGLIMRLMGKDPMHRKLEPETDSYWIMREGKLEQDFFDNQF